MTTLQINPTIAPQQHVPDVKSYNVDSVALNGATRITFKSHQLSDSDPELSDCFEQEANQRNDQLILQSAIAEEEKQATFESLYPSQKRQHLEEYWYPIITKLNRDHQLACDAVEDFEDDRDIFKARLQGEYAYRLKHPDIKTLHVAGDHHFNTLLANGSLHIEGYKLAERRSNGGGLQIVNGSPAPAQGSFTLVYIPFSVPNVLSYSESPEAKQYSKEIYDAELQRLIAKRKAFAVKLTNAKQSARDQLSAIPTFENLISDSVKRAVSRK